MSSEWSSSDEKFLIEHAGVIPTAKLAEILDRTPKSIQRKTEALRARGVPISLRCYTSELVVCPSCGCMRSSLGVLGICLPCRLRDQAEEHETAAEELLALLPVEERATYEKCDATRQSKTDPPPLAPVTDRMTRYQAAKAMDAYDRAMEAWAIRNNTRLADKARQRKGRIKEALEEITKKTGIIPDEPMKS